MTSKSIILAVLALVFSASKGYAQAAGAYGSSSKSSGPGNALIHEEPLIVHQSLLELINDASIIVEGLVDSSLPARTRDPKNTQSIETDAVVLVSATLKGTVKADNGFTRIVVAQNGGTMNGFRHESATEARLQPGDKVVLFLVPDARPDLPSVAGGLPRFQIAGIWSGKFRVERGTVVVPHASSAGLQIYNKKSLDILRADILANVR